MKPERLLQDICVETSSRQVVVSPGNLYLQLSSSHRLRLYLLSLSAQEDLLLFLSSSSKCLGLLHQRGSLDGLESGDESGVHGHFFTSWGKVIHVFHHSQVACFGSACDPCACLTVTDLARSLHSRKLLCRGLRVRGNFECALAAAQLPGRSGRY